MSWALLLLAAGQPPATPQLAQGGAVPAAVAAYRRAYADCPTDSTLRDGLAAVRNEVAYPPGLTAPPLTGVRHAVSQLDLVLLSVASGLLVTAGGVWPKRGTARRGGGVAALGLAGWAITLALAFAIEIERRGEAARPALVVTAEAALRGGNGPNFPPRWPVPLPPGVEAVERHRRGGWVQVSLHDGTAGGLVGWLPEDCVTAAARPTRIAP